MASERLHVEVVYAERGAARIVALEVPPGSSVRNAVERSRIADELPGFDLAAVEFGGFGIRRDAGWLVKDGDRVEIYRPLTADARKLRQERAAAARASGLPDS